VYLIVIAFPSVPRGMFRSLRRQVNAKRARRANQFSFAVRPHCRDAKPFRDRVREKSIFVCQFKLIWAVQSSDKKYYHFAFLKFMACCRRSAPMKGRTRRHERGAECGGRGCADRRAARSTDGKVVWSWRAHAGAKLSRIAPKAARE
jgi:hypothetical protein